MVLHHEVGGWFLAVDGVQKIAALSGAFVRGGSAVWGALSRGLVFSAHAFTIIKHTSQSPRDEIVRGIGRVTARRHSLVECGDRRCGGLRCRGRRCSCSCGCRATRSRRGTCCGGQAAR